MSGIVRLRVRYPGVSSCLKLSPGPCTLRKCRFHLEADESKGSRSNAGVQLRQRLAAREEAGTNGIVCAIDAANIGPMTLETAGKILGLTRERVRQIEEQALRKLERVADGFGEMHMVKLLRALRDG